MTGHLLVMSDGVNNSHQSDNSKDIVILWISFFVCSFNSTNIYHGNKFSFILKLQIFREKIGVVIIKHIYFLLRRSIHGSIHTVNTWENMVGECVYMRLLLQTKTDPILRKFIQLIAECQRGSFTIGCHHLVALKMRSTLVEIEPVKVHNELCNVEVEKRILTNIACFASIESNRSRVFKTFYLFRLDDLLTLSKVKRHELLFPNSET